MDTSAQTLRPATPQQIAWLSTELGHWQATGVLAPDQASDILRHYRPESDRRGVRLSLGRVLLALGGTFVGVGLVWLVAANLDRFSPGSRFLVVAALWLAFLLGGEALAQRRTSPPVVGAVRLMAALGFGALVFQAAQSLQVPAFEPRLVGVWAAGALLHGYVARAVAPFLVGLAAGVFWWIAQPLWAEPSGLGVVVLLGAGGVLAAALAVLHDGRPGRFGWWWRLLAAGFALVTLFAAAVPDVGTDEARWSTWLVAEVVVAAVAAVAAVAVAARNGNVRRALEPLGAVAVLLVAVPLAVWDVSTDVTDLDAASTARAGLSVVAYAVLAVAIAALGTVREHRALTGLAMTGLVVFTTFQSFAVFAPIVTGAWLFVVLGTVFLGTGYLFDRARRELVAALDTDGASS
jgi:uncharacterized membrane protein